METIKNVNQLFVAKNIAKTATASLVIDAVTDIADGEVCIVDPRNNVQLTTAGYPAGLNGFRVCQRSGSNLIFSDVVRAGTVRSFSISIPANSASTQQIDTIGYNGTSGALDVIANNIYTIRMYILGNTITGFMQQLIKEGFYKSAAATTQRAVAKGLCESLIKNYSREPIQNLRFERINSGAQANAVAAATVSVSYGSTAIVTSDDETAVLLTGTVVRFGTSGAGTAPCYVIASNDGGAGAARVYYLDIPYQGATNGAFPAATFETVTEGNWGVMITAVAQTYDGKFDSTPLTFKTTIDFGDTAAAVVTNNQVANTGTGTYNVLAKLEKELQADEFVYRGEFYAPTDRTDVLAATTYDVVTIEYDGIEISGLGTEVRSPKTITIVQAGNGGQADVAAIGWITLLNHLIVTTWATPGAVAVVPTA